MRNYSFAPISAREYPTVRLLDNPYIWGGVQFCVNVSEKAYSYDLSQALKQHGIDWIFCPVSEEEGEQWLDSLVLALPKMLVAYKSGLKQVVHCDFGNNRSRSFVEALYYCLHNEHFQDEYKDEINHLVYNCTIKHLPPLAETEEVIRNIGSSFR
jgi:hypothetical protein